MQPSWATGHRGMLVPGWPPTQTSTVAAAAAAQAALLPDATADTWRHTFLVDSSTLLPVR